MSTVKHNIKVLCLSAIISALVIFLGVKDKSKQIFEARTFHGTVGWGYEIFVNGKLFIRQEYVPGLPGHSGFAQEKQAAETARLIINKMKNGRPPTVSNFEMLRIFAVHNYDHQRKPQ